MVPAYNPLRIKAIVKGRPVAAFLHDSGTWAIDGRGRQELLPGLSDEAVVQDLNAA